MRTHLSHKEDGVISVSSIEHGRPSPTRTDLDIPTLLCSASQIYLFFGEVACFNLRVKKFIFPPDFQYNLQWLKYLYNTGKRKADKNDLEWNKYDIIILEFFPLDKVMNKSLKMRSSCKYFSTL